jgi:hypothetical protein
MKAQDVRFGIEIETMIKANNPTPIGGYHSGHSISWAPAGWTTQADGSIRAENGYKAMEVVSPILQGEDGLRQVIEVVDALKHSRRDCQVNNTCGIHVHIDGNIFSTEAVERLIKLFAQVQDAVFGSNGEKALWRQDNQYCRRITEGMGIDQVATSRYYALNISNWYARRLGKNTVEFRCFASTLDIDLIFAIISLCIGLALAAVEDKAIKNTNNPVKAIGECMDSYRIMPDVPIYDTILLLFRKNRAAEGVC